MFLRKQTARQTLWSTQLNFQPSSTRAEAGTVLWWNYFTYSSIGLRMDSSGDRFVYFRPAEGPTQSWCLRTPDADVLLLIKCEELQYIFGFREVVEGHETLPINDGCIMWVGSVSTDVMTRDPEVGAAFTGMMMGLYAFGDMERCLEPAKFKFAAFE